MYKRILVAVDGSEIAGGALAEAVGLARDAGATLRIVHVIEEPAINLEPGFDYNHFHRTLRSDGEELLAAAQAAASEAGRNVETGLIDTPPFGARPSDAIVAEAARWRADLIVVGTHGRRGLHRLLLGSVAEGVARASNVPVLLVRH
jgi:nucleotide-binding universal stress UspA family protein